MLKPGILAVPGPDFKGRRTRTHDSVVSRISDIRRFGSPSVSQLEPNHMLAKSGEYAADSERFLYTVGANLLIAEWIGRIERLPEE